MADFVFERYEQKYHISTSLYDKFLSLIKNYLEVHKYGKTTIQSLNYDTDDYRLIRESIEKPIYKEKLRVRCYGLNNDNRDIYIEMKRKYEGIVYKRRLSCKEYSIEKTIEDSTSQIGKEISYFYHYYGTLKPKIMIHYDRVAYYDQNSDLRITFDFSIRYRKENLNFHSSLNGKNLFDSDIVLIEIKSSHPFPLWLCSFLSKEQIYKCSFSKYGNAYQQEIKEELLMSKAAMKDWKEMT